MRDKRTVVDSANGDPIAGCTLKAYKFTESNPGSGTLIGTYIDDGDGNYYLNVTNSVQACIGIVNPSVSSTEVFPESLNGIMLKGDDILDKASKSFDTICDVELALDDSIGSNYFLAGGNISGGGTDGAFLYGYGSSSQVYKSHLYITWPYSADMDSESSHTTGYSGIGILDYDMSTGDKVLYNYDTVNTAGELHQTPSLIISDDEHIIVALDKLASNDHNGGIMILKSTNKLDVSSFSEITTLSSGYGSYPSLMKNKDGRIVCNWRGVGSTTWTCERGISYSDDNGATWTSPYKLLDTNAGTSGSNDYWAYATNDVMRRLGDKFVTVLTIQDRSSSPRTYKVHLLFSEDGLTWTNYDGTFTRTFTPGTITGGFDMDELDANFKISDTTSSANGNFVYYTSIASNGDVYLTGREYDYNASTSHNKVTRVYKLGNSTQITSYEITLPSITGYSSGYFKWNTPLNDNKILVQAAYANASDSTKDVNVGFIVNILETTTTGAVFISFDFPFDGTITNSVNGLAEFNFANINDNGGSDIVYCNEQRGGTTSLGESKLFCKKISMESDLTK